MDQSGGSELDFEFTGTYNHSLDAKGRLTLPSAVRDHLNAGSAPPKFALGLDKQCLVIYPKPVWLEFLAKLRALPRTDQRAEAVKRVLLSSAFDCEIDKQGRALVPPHLRDLAGLRRDVTLVGAIDRVEIWDRGRWSEYFRQSHDTLDADAKSLPL